MLFNRHYFASSVVIKHQLSLTKVGDFLEKDGMGILPDPLGGGTYNLSATPREKSLRGQDYYSL